MRFLKFILLMVLHVPTASLAAAIHDAAKEGDVAGITSALDAGANVDEIYKGATPLHLAVRGGHLEAAKLLVERGADVNAAPTPALGPALLPALAKRRIDLIELLLAAGADPNWQGGREAALHMAVRGNCFECVKALVESGADVNAKTKDGKTGLHLARLKGQNEIADYLLLHGVVHPEPTPISMKLATADVEKGRAVFGQMCDGCHSVDPLKVLAEGPNLWGVVGRDKASLADTRYSDALRGWEGVWTFEDLNNYLLAPMLARPGVYMEVPGVPDETERTNLIAYLRTLGDKPVPLP
ncbi:MAG: ankyrin repeat domain-containing protein [Gemmobacter sp.]